MQYQLQSEDDSAMRRSSWRWYVGCVVVSVAAGAVIYRVFGLGGAAAIPFALYVIAVAAVGGVVEGRHRSKPRTASLALATSFLVMGSLAAGANAAVPLDTCAKTACDIQAGPAMLVGGPVAWPFFTAVMLAARWLVLRRAIQG